jgi:hypothetical protein
MTPVERIKLIRTEIDGIKPKLNLAIASNRLMTYANLMVELGRLHDSLYTEIDSLVLGETPVNNVVCINSLLLKKSA